MEIKSLDNDTLIAEACCGERDLSMKAKLTDEERTRLRAAKIKIEWLKKMMPQGLSAKIAYEGEEAVGFIEYMPIELSNYLKGKDLFRINCMLAPHTPPWGEPHRERIPGCGSALVQAMIADVKGKCKGIVTPKGFAYTSDMKDFFKKFGFEEFENKGLKMLIKRFEPVGLPSRVKYEKKYRYTPIPGKLVIDVFWSSICPIAGPWQLLNIKDAAEEFGDRVIINEICTDEIKALRKYGVDPIISRSSIFFNGKPMFDHPGPADKKEMLEALKKHFNMR